MFFDFSNNFTLKYIPWCTLKSLQLLFLNLCKFLNYKMIDFLVEYDALTHKLFGEKDLKLLTPIVFSQIKF